MTINSKFYSAVCSPRLTGTNLPHITIQCPVYKEGLHSVIAPTVKSIKQAISTYELQGGSANMFINDDGLQIIDEEERRARIEFYADHSIGWTARPKHGKDGFVRKGKFKKVCRCILSCFLRLSRQPPSCPSAAPFLLRPEMVVRGHTCIRIFGLGALVSFLVCGVALSIAPCLVVQPIARRSVADMNVPI